MVAPLKNPRVYLSLAVENEKPRTVVFQLFADLVPKTVENFRALCTGEKGYSKAGTRLHYRNTKILKIIPGFGVQAGDIQNNDGTGGESIYGETFEDEKFALKHVRAGLLSMVNNGPNSNQSQFYILLNPAPQLDGKNVVFGCIEDGFDALRWLESIETVDQDRPLRTVTITDCGEVGAPRKTVDQSLREERTESSESIKDDSKEKRRHRKRRSRESSISSSERHRSSHKSRDNSVDNELRRRDHSREDKKDHRRSYQKTDRVERDRKSRHDRKSRSRSLSINYRQGASRHSSREESSSPKKQDVKRRGRGSFRYVSEAEIESGMDALPRFAASNSR
eukprot:jgi/Galph1/899/GphlegSOOS_G5637.1